MQTFAPYSSFEQCAKVLDYRRLGKQRVETMQILETLIGTSGKNGWKNHPACKQWSGFENALVDYGVIMCEEWIRRGYKDTTLAKIKKFYNPVLKTALPRWWGKSEFHASHRSVLLFKDPTWYSQFGWTEPAKYEYWWPTQNSY